MKRQYKHELKQLVNFLTSGSVIRILVWAKEKQKRVTILIWDRYVSTTKSKLKQDFPKWPNDDQMPCDLSQSDTAYSSLL